MEYLFILFIGAPTPPELELTTFRVHYNSQRAIHLVIYARQKSCCDERKIA